MLAAAQNNPCDLNGDRIVDVLDVQIAIAMRSGLRPCRANIAGANICNDAVVASVRAASLGGRCDQNPRAVLNWTASPSASVTGYNVYRALNSRGPYTRITAAPVAGTTYIDTTVEAGRTYYYVATAVNAKQESPYSNEATVAVPQP